MIESVSIKDNTSKISVKNGIEKDTFHIHIDGLVQGVGFRPFVYHLAKQFELTGWVNNSTDGVHIEFNSDNITAVQFYEKLIQQSPSLSKITKHSLAKVKQQDFSSFEIIESEINAEAKLMLTPDFAMCPDCKAELHDIDNFRYQYPFITCTHCGPRYSIITSLPYDRPNTTMHSFEMCEVCNDEYNNAEDRRHYSQTNSCSDCGIKMEMYDTKGNKLFSDNSSIINTITEALKQGKIIGVKGIGGYLLLCDANNAESIKTLRERKHRPAKPFALMFPYMASIEKIAILEKNQADVLQSFVAPIVLLEVKENCIEQICLKEIAPNLSWIGVMLPYTPLFDLILSKFGKPLVATSANISDSPIIFKNSEALESLFSVADFIVTNNREIVVPQDDSVIQFTKISKQQIIIRRSRGLAPSYFNYDCKTDETILATGALLKSSFTFVNKNNTYISQYLGSTQSYEAQETYSKTVQHFFNLFNKQPDVILTDKHPQYFSNQFAKELATQLNGETIEIQHHKAHFASVLAENKLLHQPYQPFNLSTNQPVLGIIWDGTGLGDDGNIWGGEFFKYENNKMRRVSQFEYFPFILGDKMPKEPRISALVTCAHVPRANKFLLNKFSETEWKLYQQMLLKYSSFSSLKGAGIKSLQCSSVGRIFDAVSSLLNLCDKQSYEGEAAMLLQEQALTYFNKNGWVIQESYFIENSHFHRILTSLLMQGIVFDIGQGKSTEFIAAKFHYSLVNLIGMMANHLELKNVAFSGGVFLNSVLVDLLQLHLGENFQLFFHKELSPNDENISFGQMVYYDNKIDIPPVNKTDLKKNKVSEISKEYEQELKINY